MKYKRINDCEHSNISLSQQFNCHKGSITPSPPSDTELRVDKSTTSSETPGDQHGEMPVTSTSPPKMDGSLEVSAVSNKPPSGQT